MAFRKSPQPGMRRAGMIAAVAVFLLQMFAAATMPVMAAPSGEGTIVICTGTGMKTVLLSSLGLAGDTDSEAPEHQASSCSMCAWCSIAQDIASAPPLPLASPTAVATLVTSADRSAPAVADAFPRTPQARAPPVPT